MRVKGFTLNQFSQPHIRGFALNSFYESKQTDTFLKLDLSC